LFGVFKGISLASDVSHHTNCPLILIRKEPKDHGTGKLIELDEVQTQQKLVLVDDVISSGSTVRETIANIKRSGAPISVVGVICIVNRCVGAPITVPETDIPLHALFTLDDLLPRVQRKTFEERALIAKTPTAKLLFELMERRKTNLCFSADIELGAELLRVLEVVAPFIVAVKIHFDAVAQLDITKLFQIGTKRREKRES
jgi:hypothetical protein